ncbi:MAG: hypothetical protein HUK20_05410 [Fibrobacter sp.]|nr:hypothetical protein [Fibrobacter sp.]
MSKIKKLLASLVLCMVPYVIADGITPEVLSAGGAVARDRALNEIRQVMLGGRGGYLDLGFYYTPLATQLPLRSEYGLHDGFATWQHVSGFMSGELNKNLQGGFLLWFDRSGWDSEDFLLLPHYGDFSLVRSVTTWGLAVTDVGKDLTFAAGMQHQNVEHVGHIYKDESDSLLFSWAHLRWKKFSLQASFNETHWRSARLALDLESRAIYGGKSSGPLTYLPNVDLALYSTDGDDSLRVTWEQNLYGQMLYGVVSFDIAEEKRFHSASLKYYPDPSRMIGFEASCLKRYDADGSNDLLWGGAIDLLFLRLAYNAAYDYDNFYGAKGTFLAELKFSLSTIDGLLFGRGGTRSAPIETDILKEKNKEPENNQRGWMNNSSSETKTLEARGVRFDKSKGGK